MTESFNEHSSLSELFSDSSLPGEGEQPSISRLQYLDKTDLLNKISHAIFEDFHQNSNAHYEGEDSIAQYLSQFVETCDYALKTFERLGSNCNSDSDNTVLKNTLNELTLERCSYDLMLRILNLDQLYNSNGSKDDSFLSKILRSDERFMRIMLMLRWTEENGRNFPTEFSNICMDAYKLNSLDNVYACSKIRGPIHFDSRFTDRIAAEDEESFNILNRVIFSFLRAGRIDEAKGLVEKLAIPTMLNIIAMREFLTEPALSPTDPLDDNFNLSKSRLFFKEMVKNLLQMRTCDERIQRADHCIWATVSGNLHTLLSYANNSEDRLWSYLSCAAESIFDNALLEVHSKHNDELNKIRVYDNSELPLDISSIFRELNNVFNSESSCYYEIIGKIAVQDWLGVIHAVSDRLKQVKQCAESDELPPHELRYYTHLVILISKLEAVELDRRDFDKVLHRYVDLLIRMHLCAVVPFYLFQLTDKRVAKNKMIDFLELIRDESEQKIVLERALEVGFDTADLCRDVFERFKNKYPIRLEELADDNRLSKSIFELLRAWKWLTHCGTETIWDALIEANYILRKLFIHHRMSEAMDLLTTAPENLHRVAVECFKREFPGEDKIPEKLDAAKREYECYILYFDAINKYNTWQKHVEGQEPPQPPAKLSDEAWARMDMRRRTEYEVSIQRARECLQKYINLAVMLKKAAVESLERFLKNSEGWLVMLSPENDEETDPQFIERAKDFCELRKHYFFHVMKLLVHVHSKSGEMMNVLELGNLLVDPRYNIHKALSVDLLRQLLALISKSGTALLY